MDMINVNELVRKITGGYRITREEAVELAGSSQKEVLYGAADRIRRHFCGDRIETCSICNARSGICSEDCKWCSQSVYHSTGVARYDIIDEEDALEAARMNGHFGVQRFSLVTASRDFPKGRLQKACDIYRKIKNDNPGLSLCASMGLLDQERLQMLKEAGVTHYHMNMETSRRYFPNLVSKHTYDDKLRTIALAKEAGLEICSGGIIGMGETMEDRIDLAFQIRKIGARSIPVNILNPIAGTPLEGMPRLSDEDVLVSIALFRFINPDSYMRFAGGRLLIAHLVEKALRGGMNAIMVGDMLTTHGSKIEEDFALIEKMGFIS